MSESEKFLHILRDAMAPLVRERGLREVKVNDTIVFKAITYTNAVSFIRFAFDNRDGYLDVTYGSASDLDIIGERTDGVPFTFSGSINAFLGNDGVVVPHGKELYVPGKLTKMIHELVKTIERHEKTVFPL